MGKLLGNGNSLAPGSQQDYYLIYLSSENQPFIFSTLQVSSQGGAVMDKARPPCNYSKLSDAV